MFIKAQDGNLYNLDYARKIEICALSQPESLRDTLRQGDEGRQRVASSSLFYVLRAFFGESGDTVDLADYDSLEEIEAIRDQLLKAMGDSFDLPTRPIQELNPASDISQPIFTLVPGQQT